MHPRIIASILVGAIGFAQLSIASAQATPAPTTTTVVVPTGTVVPLTLVNPIKHKSTKPGDTVRARVAFPITVGDQVAIPPGTIVEGIFNKPPKGKKAANQPNVSIHFVKLIYANGYTVPLDSINTADLMPLLPPPPVDYAMFDRPAFHSHGPSPDPDPQTNQFPTNPYAHSGPTTKELVAFTVGPVAFGGLLFTLFHFSRPHGDYLMDAAGWQFQMTLQSPLSVDVSSVTAAAATPAK